MSTLRQEISNIRSTFKWINSDTKITDRFISSKLKSIALKFIKQATDKRKLWNSPNIFTPISCLSMVQVPLAECCDYESECQIARSEFPIPRIAEGTHFGMLIQGVYSVDGIGRKFKDSSADRYANSLDMNLKTNDVHYWIQYNSDGYYLYASDEQLEEVKLVAYFEEDVPLNLLNCKDIPCCPTNPLDQEYKVPGYMRDDIQKELETQLLQTFKRSIEDKTEDNKDDSK